MAPARFMHAGGRRADAPRSKRQLNPTSQIGGAAGTDASSLQLAPSGSAMVAAAQGMRQTKKPKTGQLIEPTDAMPYTNKNVKNRGRRMGTDAQRQGWMAHICKKPDGGLVGDPGHWSNTAFTYGQWLVIEEAPKNTPAWDQAVEQKWIQPGELDPANGYFKNQARVLSPQRCLVLLPCTACRSLRSLVLTD
jgi:hypothetical protein